MENKSPDLKVYVAGHRGMVGQALVKVFRENGYKNIIHRTHAELDLTDEIKTREFIADERPDVVLLAAAKVGGIVANNEYRADFLIENLRIQNNVLWSSFRAKVPHVIFLGSTCVYPRIGDREIEESDLLGGYLEYTNRPYAVAKIAGLELVNAMNEQYGTKYFSVMPTNLYGPGDTYDERESHVIPALILKFHQAKMKNAPEVTMMGSGNAMREFLYSEDLARAVLACFRSKEALFREVFPISAHRYYHLSLGSTEELTIRDLARKVADCVGYRGNIVFSNSDQDGTPRKKVSTTLSRKYCGESQVQLSEGLALSYANYLSLTGDGG